MSARTAGNGLCVVAIAITTMAEVMRNIRSLRRCSLEHGGLDAAVHL
jgi:hypothetical protein